MTLYHATCVAVDGDGVLIRGPSGAGKSALALQLIDQGAQLVADDQCELWVNEDQLLVQSPDRLKGLLEIRGFGIVRLAYLEHAAIGLVADLKPVAEIERLPEDQNTIIEGMECPRIELDPELPDTPARLRLALAACTKKGAERIS